MSNSPSGFIVIRLAVAHNPEAEAEIANVNDLSESQRFDAIANLLKEYDVVANRLAPMVSAADRREVHERARRRGHVLRWNLSSFWCVDARKVPDPEELVARLNALDVVDKAYQQSVGSEQETING
jgi:putative SOS response-associated peptidase YedK